MTDDLKIKKNSLSDQIYEVIAKQITSGIWKIGDKLPSEAELADTFGVNRLTIRGALQKLNAMVDRETSSPDAVEMQAAITPASSRPHTTGFRVAVTVAIAIEDFSRPGKKPAAMMPKIAETKPAGIMSSQKTSLRSPSPWSARACGLFIQIEAGLRLPHTPPASSSKSVPLLVL